MIGIYGGTFDPIHYGHLRTALEVKEAVGLGEVRFVPCHIPPHRPTPSTTSEQRRALLEVAMKEAEPGFRLDTRELDRSGPSYMVDTLVSLRTEVGPTVPVCLLVGQDAFVSLSGWYRWEMLFELAHVLVIQRSGTWPSLPEMLQTSLLIRQTDTVKPLHDHPCGYIYSVSVTQFHLSATHIRKLIVAGKSARYLTPDAVLDLIYHSGLYQSVSTGK